MIKSDQRLHNISILLILAAMAFAVTFLCSYLIMPGQRALAGDQDIFYEIGQTATPLRHGLGQQRTNHLSCQCVRLSYHEKRIRGCAS